MSGGSNRELGDDGDDRVVTSENLGTLFGTDDERFRSLVEIIDDVLLKLDDDGRVEFANGAVESTLGFDRQELVGEPIGTVLSTGDGGETDTGSAAELLARLEESDDGTGTVPAITADGEQRRLRLSASAVDGGDGYICLARDVTERERVEREREQYAQLVGAVGDPMYVLDADGTLERVNDAMVEYTGYGRTELVGRDIGEIIPAREYDRATSRLAELAETDTRRSETFETTLVTKGGQLILTEANVTALTDGDGEFVGSVGALRDIRERKQRERDLDMLKQVLTRVFRHNVRNELTVVQGNAEFVHSQVDDDLREYTGKIIERSEQLLSHTEKARLMEEVIDTEERYKTDLAGVVDRIAGSYRDDHPAATIEVDVPSGTTVEAHTEIGSAIEELLDNAIQHAPDGETPRIRVWTDETDEFLTLFVEDESGGLADHEIDVLRKGAESDLEHGSGVGLWLVRWVVEYSDADMIAHRTDEGSLMGIRFPHPDRGAIDEGTDVEESPFARVPAHVRGDISPERFHGEIVIGRREELHQLEDAYDDLERKGGHAVLITGETGVGKSTLVEQFRDRVRDHQQPPLLANGTCAPGMTAPYHVFRQAMAELPVATQLQELLTDVAEFAAEDPETVQHRKQALFADIADELRELAIDHPLVLVVEDLQWADRGTVELFEFLIDEVGRWATPIMFLGTYRLGDVGEAHPVLEIAERMADAGRGSLLKLEPFGPEDVKNLLEYMLDVEEIPDRFVTAVFDHTGGTPLFVAEIGRHLAETLGPAPQPGDLPDDLASISVPDSVESAVTDRLEGLPEAVGSVLEVGAVIGETVSFDVLRETSALPEAELVEAVDDLVQRRIWSRSEGTLQFVHGIIRENALATIDADRRERIHARVAGAIETVHADAIEEQYGRLATHYHEAGQFETALEFYREAGENAAEAYAHGTAIEHYERALEIAESLDAPDLLFEAAYRLAEIHLTTGEYDQADGYVRRLREEVGADTPSREQRVGLLAARAATGRGAYDEAEEEVLRGLGVTDAPSRDRCRLLDVAVRLWRDQGRYEKARETADRLRELAGEVGEPQIRAEAIRNLGMIAFRQSDHGQAEAYTRECLGIARELGNQQLQADSLHSLGVIAWARGNYEQAREHYEESLDTKHEIGDRHGGARTLNNLGLVAQEQGNYDQAREYYEECLETYRDLGDRHGEAKTLNNLGIVARIQGDYGQAREYYQESLGSKREVGDRHGEAKSFNNLGEIARQQGEYDQAREYLEESLAIKRDLGDRRDVAESLTHLGLVAYRERELEEAREHLEEGLEIARELGATEKALTSLWGLGAIARTERAYDEANEYLDEALALRDDDGDPVRNAQVHLEAGRLSLAEGEIESARDHLGTALDTFRELGVAHWVGRCRQLDGEIAREAGTPDEAGECWESARETFAAVGAPQDELATLERLVDLCREHDEGQAREWCRRAQDVLEDAPDPVAGQHREWVETVAAALGVE